MQNFSSNPLHIYYSFWKNRRLIFNLAQREVVGRYRGSILGLLWSFVNPVLLLVMYTFVFSGIFKARWSGATESQEVFALALFAGMIPFALFSECISRAPSLILSNVNLVKKVVFPLEVLSWVFMGSATFNAFITYIIWIIAYLIFLGMPSLTILWFPIIMLPFIFMTMGLSWFFASLGVFIRDVSHFVSLAVTMLMFISPVFYPMSSLPEQYRNLLYLNPLCYPIELSRDVLFWGRAPNLSSFLIYSAFSFIVFSLGFAWFQKTRKGFSDVL